MISYHATRKGIVYNDPDNFVPYDYKTVKDLCSIILNYTWSPVIFKNNYRAGSNFGFADLCVLDVDNDKPEIPVCSIEQAKEEFCDCKVIIGTTRNHRRAKKPGDPIEDRFRVILVFEERIENVEQYRASVEAMKGPFDFVDKATLEPGRQFFPCTSIVHVQGEGEKIPVRQALVQTSKSQICLEMAISASRPLPRHIVDFLVDGKIFAGGRNNSIYHCANHLIQKGINLTEALKLIHEAPFDKSYDFKLSEIDATVRGVYKRKGIG
jgi:hypothetical protein